MIILKPSSFLHIAQIEVAYIYAGFKRVQVNPGFYIQIQDPVQVLKLNSRLIL